MISKGPLLILALLATACSGGSNADPAPSTTAPPEIAAPDETADLEAARAAEERAATIAAWADRPVGEIFVDGFDATPCVRGQGTADGEPRTVTNLGWAFLPLPLDLVDLERSNGETGRAVTLSGDEIFPGARFGYVPTHSWIHSDDLPMAERLAAEATTDGVAEIVLGFGPTDQGRAGDEPERLAFASFGWILRDGQVIPFSGECDWITTFTAEVGDPLTELELLRADPFRRAEIAGLSVDRVDFADCTNNELDLLVRHGFGGEAAGMAFGPWPPDADTFTDIVLDGWTVIPPVGDAAPTYAVHGDEGFPSDAGLDPNGWFMTFTVVDDRAEVDTIFHVDELLGLRVWGQVEQFDAIPCHQERQILAFQEWLEGEGSDRAAWDIPPALPGDEATVVETIRLLMTDAETRDKFHEWIPCNYRLCEYDGTVDR